MARDDGLRVTRTSPSRRNILTPCPSEKQSCFPVQANQGKTGDYSRHRNGGRRARATYSRKSDSTRPRQKIVSFATHPILKHTFYGAKIATCRLLELAGLCLTNLGGVPSFLALDIIVKEFTDGYPSRLDSERCRLGIFVGFIV
ncbi:hypothetical protein Naga_100202g2 [Nannochloropsis gaditana]|uniref:Uncharacterized protein n=1 Tax=Nannochloropsis gaditana TaxID=72520 RepID=W7TC72_9STRA|nr:hypothetical protein Naga_100202g2 [Nannochloropsis gaditana]